MERHPVSVAAMAARTLSMHRHRFTGVSSGIGMGLGSANQNRGILCGCKSIASGYALRERAHFACGVPDLPQPLPEGGALPRNPAGEACLPGPHDVPNGGGYRSLRRLPLLAHRCGAEANDGNGEAHGPADAGDMHLSCRFCWQQRVGVATVGEDAYFSS
jgi:hypothetical protein